MPTYFKSSLVSTTILLLGLLSPDTLNVHAAPPTCPNGNELVVSTTDILFLIDSSPSMCPYSAAIATGMAKYVQQLADDGINAQYAVASFGGPPTILQSFTVRHIHPLCLHDIRLMVL
jgi:hypothetical protein